MSKKVLPEEAAIILNCSPQYVRQGLQLERLKFGSAVKMSTKWTYNISVSALSEHCKRDVTAELEEIRKNRREKKAI